MKAVEVMGKIDEKGQLFLDKPLEIDTPSRVKVILLFSEENEIYAEDTPDEEIKASLRRALQEAKEGKTKPISKLWERIDND